MAITINCDIGEGYGLYTFGNDERIMPFISIANVACGFHASDPTVMHATVRLALEHGVKVGAHPSLPDRQGFGRREMQMERDELRDLLIYQVGALKGFLEAARASLNHIKPHGALFGIRHSPSSGRSRKPVDLAAQPRHLALGDARHPHRLHQASTERVDTPWM